MSTPRALIYCRVSSDPSGRRVSVQSQEAENRAYCATQGWQVVGVVVDNDRSASRRATREREGYADVLARIQGGDVDVLVCWESSRATRNLTDYAQVRDLCATAGVLFAYSGRVFDLTRSDDRLATGLDALLAEREADQIHERVMRGVRGSVARGAPHGTTPYGYIRQYEPTSGALVAQIPDPKTAPIIREIVARIIAGDPLRAIVADFNRRGVPAPQQRKDTYRGVKPGALGWSSSKIRKLVASRSMTGYRTHKGVLHAEATWEPLVSVEDYELAAASLADPERGRHHRGVAPKHLLSGIAQCGVCAAWLRPDTNRGVPSYRCEGHGPGDPRGKAHVVRAREPLDRYVTRPLLRRLQQPDVLALFARDDEEQAVAEARREVTVLQRRLADYEDLAVAGEVSPTAFARIEAGLRDQLARAQARAVPRSVPAAVLDIAGPHAVEVWARWGVEPGGLVKRRQVVRALLEVRVHRSTQRGARGFDAASVKLRWRSAAAPVEGQDVEVVGGGGELVEGVCEGGDVVGDGEEA